MDVSKDVIDHLFEFLVRQMDDISVGKCLAVGNQRSCVVRDITAVSFRRFWRYRHGTEGFGSAP